MRALFKIFLRLARCTSGAALVEATIALPVAISLMAGGVDFGLALASQATGSKSVRGAARYLATLPVSAICNGTVLNSQALLNAQNLAVYGKLNPVTGVDMPLITGWAANGGSNNYVKLIQPTSSACASNGINIIQLQAEFPYTSIMLSAILPNASTLTLFAQHEERSIGQ